MKHIDPEDAEGILISYVEDNMPQDFLIENNVYNGLNQQGDDVAQFLKFSTLTGEQTPVAIGMGVIHRTPVFFTVTVNLPRTVKSHRKMSAAIKHIRKLFTSNQTFHDLGFVLETTSLNDVPSAQEYYSKSLVISCYVEGT